MENKRHVQLPNDMTKTPDITPKDLVIYLAIKRHMNNETKESFPSLDLIVKESGASINTVRKCLANLKEAKYIDIRKEGRKNIYVFSEYKNFEPFSYAFLDKEDLSFTEKAYLVASQQYMYKDNEEGKISIPNTQLAKLINMPESTIRKCDKSLQDKEYVQVIKTGKKDPITGLAITEKFYHLNKLEQAIVFVLTKHEEQIQQNTEDIESLKRDRDILLKELAEIKKKLNGNNSQEIII